MKKNIAMRVAAILFILTMISTCAFSTTFAKYITTDNLSDNARVAKWGVTVEASDTSMFKSAYDTDNTEVKSSIAQSVSADTNVVAPGTNGKVVVITIAGKPEVAVNVKFVLTIESDIHLIAGDYLDYTTGGDTTDEFTLGADYYPVVFTLTEKLGTNAETVVKTGKLSEIKEALEGKSANYTHNTDLAAVYTISWAWAFEKGDDADTKALYNKADTYLACQNPVQSVKFSIEATVTQVD